MTIENKKQQCRQWFQELQKTICKGLETIENDLAISHHNNDIDIEQPHNDHKDRLFNLSHWQRSKNHDNSQGGGIMGMLKGHVFEKAGVHFSCVYGQFSEEFRKKIKGTKDDPSFFATGVSVIVHPYHPCVPAIHMNTRYIVTSQNWFGGGIDLNPMLKTYRQQTHEDTQFFHSKIKALCENHHVMNYATCKHNCDEYFWLEHRQEPRGVGGIFYDNLNSRDFNADFAFTKELGQSFLDIYAPLVYKNQSQPFSPADKKEQLKQRGRYAEFNLLYDKGTTFGLQTGGNVESILSSLPPIATWS